MIHIAKENKKSRLKETLRDLADAENTLNFCLKHLSVLVKNGRIKNRFNSFAQFAGANKEVLIKKLKDLGSSGDLSGVDCKFCRIKPESFSLFGAINLGLEIIGAEIKLYRRLLNLIDDEADGGFFKRILEEKAAQKKFLKNEKNFVSGRESSSTFIDSYCLPQVVSKLWQ